MDFKTFTKQNENMVENHDIPDNTAKNLDNGNNENISENGRLFDIVDPDTGLKYDIPMLSRTDPDYFYKYVYYMKMKEKSPSAFEQIINWE